MVVSQEEFDEGIAKSVQDISPTILNRRLKLPVYFKPAPVDGTPTQFTGATLELFTSLDAHGTLQVRHLPDYHFRTGRGGAWEACDCDQR